MTAFADKQASVIRTITPEYVDDLIDFAPTEEIKAAGINVIQRDGTVALFNMLATNGVAYLADEVGMGKTYIGLAVMSLLRYQKPDARVLVLTPRRNIQEKWATDLQNFVRYNWKRADHRVKTPQGSPDFPTKTPERLADWLNDLHDQELGAHDSILRMTSFSLGVADEEGDGIGRFKSYLHAPLTRHFEHLSPGTITRKSFADAFRQAMAPIEYDLIIVDEAHNLKYGFTPGTTSSIRNEVMYHLFGRNASRPNAPKLLMLSATPMENGDPETMVRQFDLFGKTDMPLHEQPADDSNTVLLSMLANDEDSSGEVDHIRQRQRQKRLIVRRVGELRLKGPPETALTRNMYRREWRAGGVSHPDQPLEKPTSAVRLVNAVLQKNVFEMLQSSTGGSFRIGALESFEIYSGRSSQFTETDNNQPTSESAPDRHVIARLGDSFRREFGHEVPHPKLNAVSRLLGDHLQKREKALIFVRRVATTWDLATRASHAFDDELLTRIRAVVREEDHPRLTALEDAWIRMRSTREFPEDASAPESAEQEEDVHETLAAGEDDAAGEAREDDAAAKDAVPSLFTWFFRGEQRSMAGFSDIYGGRRLREQLEARSRLSLVLEENYADWVLGRPVDLLSELAKVADKATQTVVEEVTEHLPVPIGTDANIRRQYHAVQCACLRWLVHQPTFSTIKPNVEILLDEIYYEARTLDSVEHQSNHELVIELLQTRGLYPSLARAPIDSPLRNIVARGVFEEIDEKANLDFRLALRRREQIRLLQMALLRHGSPVIDLYLAALECRNGVLQHPDGASPPPVSEVAENLAATWLNKASDSDSWRASAAWELTEVNLQFDLLKKLNLADLDHYQQTERPLDQYFRAGREAPSDAPGAPRSARRLLNQEMAGQAPTAAAQGGQSDERRHRITSHFRMPGMPWVLVATSVYEEGVDLHTYCKTVVHHGISHSASSIEQRTGRVDRIGGQVQRSTAALSSLAEFTGDKKIQSLFPYQPDTFEKHQVRRVLHNCNRFLRSLHETEAPQADQRDTSLFDKRETPPQIVDRLQSPFDVSASPWLEGAERTPDRSSDFDRQAYDRAANEFESLLQETWPDITIPSGQALDRHYILGQIQIQVAPNSDREGDRMELVLTVETHDKHPKQSRFNTHPAGSGWANEAIAALTSVL